MKRSLATKYRPITFDDVVSQVAIKKILTQQLDSGTWKNCYLFCGGAGTGKTTCARIFAREINKGQGNPIEIDAASNNSVDDVREIIKQAKSKALDSEYKVFILDEVHALSNSAWQAMLKIIEEPPMKTIFIFATTDPQKIPKTILSRVQRFDFTRITNEDIKKRLKYICEQENISSVDNNALEYITKLADGGMRDAISMLDKVIDYSSDISLNNVVDALGNIKFDEMFDLVDNLQNNNQELIIKSVETIHMSGRDLKQFIKQFINFVLDICKYKVTKTYDFVNIPETYNSRLCNIMLDCYELLDTLIKLDSEIKWSSFPKPMIEATLLLFGKEN